MAPEDFAGSRRPLTASSISTSPGDFGPADQLIKQGGNAVMGLRER
jgi:hypothetical protein